MFCKHCGMESTTPNVCSWCRHPLTAATGEPGTRTASAPPPPPPNRPNVPRPISESARGQTPYVQNEPEEEEPEIAAPWSMAPTDVAPVTPTFDRGSESTSGAEPAQGHRPIIGVRGRPTRPGAPPSAPPVSPQVSGWVDPPMEAAQPASPPPASPPPPIVRHVDEVKQADPTPVQATRPNAPQLGARMPAPPAPRGTGHRAPIAQPVPPKGEAASNRQAQPPVQATPVSPAANAPASPQPALAQPAAVATTPTPAAAPVQSTAPTPVVQAQPASVAPTPRVEQQPTRPSGPVFDIPIPGQAQRPRAAAPPVQSAPAPISVQTAPPPQSRRAETTPAHAPQPQGYAAPNPASAPPQQSRHSPQPGGYNPLQPTQGMQAQRPNVRTSRGGPLNHEPEHEEAGGLAAGVAASNKPVIPSIQAMHAQAAMNNTMGLNVSKYYGDMMVDTIAGTTYNASGEVSSAAPIPGATAPPIIFHWDEPTQNLGPLLAKYIGSFIGVLLVCGLVAGFLPDAYVAPLCFATFLGGMLLPVCRLIPWQDEDSDDVVWLLILSLVFGPAIGLVIYGVVCALRQEANVSVFALLGVAFVSRVIIELCAQHGFAMVMVNPPWVQPPAAATPELSMSLVASIFTSWTSLLAMAGWYIANVFHKADE